MQIHYADFASEHAVLVGPLVPSSGPQGIREDLSPRSWISLVCVPARGGHEDGPRWPLIPGSIPDQGRRLLRFQHRRSRCHKAVRPVSCSQGSLRVTCILETDLHLVDMGELRRSAVAPGSPDGFNDAS